MPQLSAAEREDRNIARMIPQHTRTVIRREYRAAGSDVKAHARIFAHYARKYGVSERIIRCVVTPSLWGGSS